MAIEYSDLVLEHFKNPRNLGEIENANGVHTNGSPACGDQITFYLDIDDNSKIIKDIKFKSYGCASNIATSSMMTQMVKGLTIDKAKKMSWKECCERLGGLPPAKVHCSVLAVSTLRGAIENYEKSKGENIKEQTLEHSGVLAVLGEVMNPAKGEDIVTLGMVESISIKDLDVVVNIKKLDTDDESLESIKDEIKEHIIEVESNAKIIINVI